MSARGTHPALELSYTAMSEEGGLEGEIAMTCCHLLTTPLQARRRL